MYGVTGTNVIAETNCGCSWIAKLSVFASVCSRLSPQMQCSPAFTKSSNITFTQKKKLAVQEMELFPNCKPDGRICLKAPSEVVKLAFLTSVVRKVELVGKVALQTALFDVQRLYCLSFLSPFQLWLMNVVGKAGMQQLIFCQHTELCSAWIAASRSPVGTAWYNSCGTVSSVF